MYKLVAVDLDGTLLNSYGVVTENSKNIIKKTIEKGTEVIIASGRPIDSIQSIAKDIGSNKYFIAGNGAFVYDINKDKVIYEKYLSKKKVLEIIKLCEKNSISYNIYASNAILTSSLKYNVLYYHKENSKKEENKKTNISIIENMYEYVKNMKDDKFLKITVCDDTKSIFDSIMRKLKNISGIDILDVSHISRKLIRQGTEEFQVEYYYTEISEKGVDKWNALEYLIEILNIDKSEVIAIGDNINDKKMIENSGLGIAMKHSTPIITDVCDYITDSNNDEGVANALEKFC